MYAYLKKDTKINDTAYIQMYLVTPVIWTLS